MTDIFSQNGITREEVIAWATKAYPQFVENEGVIVQLYLDQVKNKKVDPQTTVWLKGEKTLVSDLEQGAWVTLEVVVGSIVRENSYHGCPSCSKKVDVEDPLCPKCNKEVTPVEYTWIDYVAGDNSGDIIITIPPKLEATTGSLTGKVVTIRGSLNDQGNFFVNALNVHSPDENTLSAKRDASTKKSEIELLSETLSRFPQITVADLRKWHADSKLTTPLSEMLSSIGMEMKGTKVVKTNDSASSSDDDNMADAIAQFKSLAEIFPEMDMNNVDAWFKKLPFSDTLKLDDVIKAAGAKVENGKVVISNGQT